VNDITALMGKLKANVSYLQFAGTMTEERANWPVLERMMQAKKLADAEAAGATPPADESIPVGQAVASASDPSQGEPSPKLPSTSAPEPAAVPAPAVTSAAPTPPAPASAEPAPRSAPAQKASAHKPSAQQASAKPASPKPPASLLRRYKEPEPEPQQDETRRLSDIFARLERKSR
jgi:hypothetical protein